MTAETTFSGDAFRDIVQELLGDAQELPDQFKAYGKNLYLVGGVVRDFLFRHGQSTNTQVDEFESLDLDFTTDALPEEIKAIIEGAVDNIWTQGERFGTIGCRIGSTLIEITTHRAEIYTELSRKPDVDFSSDINADLSRRDFTINAMAIELTGDEFELIDPFNGQEDLQAGVLKTPLSAKVSFSDDPLRMVRAARFAARFNLDIDDGVTLAALQLNERIEIVAIERIRVELEKLLDTEKPSRGLIWLQHTGLLNRILPELQERTEAELECLWNVVDHTQQGRLFRFVQLFWLFPAPKSVRSISKRLRLSRVEADRVNALYNGVNELNDLVRRHLDDAEPTPTLAEHRKFLFHCHHLYSLDVDQLAELIKVRDQVINDMALTGEDGTTATTRTEVLEQLVTSLVTLEQVEGADTFKVPISGTDVKEALDLEAGPEIGAALQFIQQQRFERGPLSVDEAISLIRDWVSSS